MCISPLAFTDCHKAAIYHQNSFYVGWTEEDFQNFLNDPLVFGLKIEESENFCGYILWREIEDEAEILTLVVAPYSQRKGKGKLLLEALFKKLKEKGISKLYLEVAEDNKIAQSFYINKGFVLLGKRQNYYKRKENNFVDALNFLKVIEKG